MKSGVCDIVKQLRKVFISIGVLGSVLVTIAVGNCASQAVVVFPFAVGSGVPVSKTELAKQYADDMLTLITEGLRQTQRYSVMLFDPRVASVRRAIAEQLMTEKEATQPIDTTADGAAKARKLTSLVGADVAMIGSIEEYTFNEKTGEAVLTVTAQMIDVQTGSIEPVVVTGRAKRAGDRSDQTEEAIGISAAYDAAEKILTSVASVSATELTGTPNHGHESVKPEKKKGLIPAMLGAILLGYLLSGG